MNQRRVGPNDPCPCGSGRKLKRCCRGAVSAATSSTERPAADAPASGKFRFEPGSYGGNGMFAASISCKKQVSPDEWTYHFVLASSAFVFENEQEAVAAAHTHLDEASAEKARTGSDASFAAHLSGLGYLKVRPAPGPLAPGAISGGQPAKALPPPRGSAEGIPSAPTQPILHRPFADPPGAPSRARESRQLSARRR